MNLIQASIDLLLVGFSVVTVVTGVIAAVVVFGEMIARARVGW